MTPSDRPASISREERVARRAIELFEVARTCFHYARRGTPDGAMFERSEQGRLLMKAMHKIAALSPDEAALSSQSRPSGLQSGIEERLVADAVRPILRGVVDPCSKDDFEWWLDRLCARVARAATRAQVQP